MGLLLRAATRNCGKSTGISISIKDIANDHNSTPNAPANNSQACIHGLHLRLLVFNDSHQSIQDRLEFDEDGYMQPSGIPNWGL